MTKLRLAAVLLLLLSSGYAFSQNPPALCDHKAMNVQWPADSPVALKGPLYFSSYADFSEAALALHNRSSAAITQIAALIEILDGQERHLLTFEAHAIAPDFVGRVDPVPDSFPIDNGSRLDTLFFPKESTMLVPSSPIVLTQCPSRARLILLWIDNTDKKRFKYSLSGTRTDPRLKSDDLDAVRPFSVQLPYEILVTAMVGANGKANLVSIEDYPDDLPEWINKLLASWTFVPGRWDGEAVQNEVNFLFRFHADRKLDWSSVIQSRESKDQQNSGRFVVIDVYPPKLNGETPIISVAGLFLNTD